MPNGPPDGEHLLTRTTNRLELWKAPVSDNLTDGEDQVSFIFKYLLLVLSLLIITDKYHKLMFALLTPEIPVGIYRYMKWIDKDSMCLLLFYLKSDH